jgi:DNA invertase Pin-like site-specific DNA recombinase
MSEKVLEEHLRHGALVYVRQSTLAQVTENRESQRRQYALAVRARELGFQRVEVIDDDLGRSGSGMVERPGFQRLVAAVCTGEVGAVLSIEASRLARNGRDWHHLIDLCSLVGTLVIDADGVYDPRLINDRLLLGLKGTMSEFELNLLRQRSLEAIRSKARRGELEFGLPIGLCWTGEGKIELDPDRRVQEAMRLVFRKFDELGSARQVLLWFRRNKVTLPAAPRGAAQMKVVWKLPIYNTIHSLLTNPTYAGAYVYGRTGDRTCVVEGKARKTSGHEKAQDQWMVLIRDHHPGYLSWAAYERNQDTLAENAHMKKRMERKAGRGGRSLLAGLLRCRRCGRMLHVTYGGVDGRVPRYGCRGAHVNHGESWCISFGGLRPDQYISSVLLEVVQPKAVDAALQAAQRATQKHDDQSRAISLELEQARYEAGLAARRYEGVDPDNRLVAAELEARWNATLARVGDLESRLEASRHVASPAAAVDRETLLSLAANLPAVWNSAAADMKLKQRIVRMLVHEIVADVDEGTSEIVLVIHWVGGRHTELRVPKNKSGHHRRTAGEDATEVMRRMAGRWPDEQIAATLNRLRLRTGFGNTWNELRVRGVRQRLGFPAHDPAVNQSVTLTLEQAAEHLGVSPGVVRKLILRKQLPAVQAAPSAPWEISAAALESEPIRKAAQRAREGGYGVRQRAVDAATLQLPGIDPAEDS